MKKTSKKPCAKPTAKKPTTKAFMCGGKVKQKTKCYAEGGPVSTDKKEPPPKQEATDTSTADKIKKYRDGSALERRMRDAGV